MNGERGPAKENGCREARVERMSRSRNRENAIMVQNGHKGSPELCVGEGRGIVRQEPENWVYRGVNFM